MSLIDDLLENLLPINQIFSFEEFDLNFLFKSVSKVFSDGLNVIPLLDGCCPKKIRTG